MCDIKLTPISIHPHTFSLIIDPQSIHQTILLSIYPCINLFYLTTDDQYESLEKQLRESFMTLIGHIREHYYQKVSHLQVLVRSTVCLIKELMHNQGL